MKENIDVVIAALVKAKITHTEILIEGFTDEKGSEADNKELGKKRAEAGKAYLVTKCVNGKCIDPAIITTKGVGETYKLGDLPDCRGIMITFIQR